MELDRRTPAQPSRAGPLRRWPASATPRALVLAAVVAAIVGHAHAGEARAVLSVTAYVVDTAGIGSSYQAQELVITPRDVERGYVDVAAASRFHIRNKGPSVLEFRATGDVFRSVRVTGAAGTAEFGSGGGTLLQKASNEGSGSLALNYRFELAPGIGAGPHKWPLALTVYPL